MLISFLLLLAAMAGPASARGLPGVEIRSLGRLNVNTATREQLLTVPQISVAVVDTILKTRKEAPLIDLSALGKLPPAVLAHLKLEGASDYRRIRKLPLRSFEPIKTAHAGR